MLKVFPLEKDDVDSIVSKTDRSQMEYFEYSFLKDENLQASLKKKLENLPKSDDAICFVVKDNSEPFGTLMLHKNQFDSENFDMACFHAEFKIFNNEPDFTSKIMAALYYYLEDYLGTISGKKHLFISLNNNTHNNNQLLNFLLSKGFFYIHTLLTFSQTNSFGKNEDIYKNGLKIRKAIPADAESIERLAEKSFNYSRFHLDPFLDDSKANKLLKTSARNSVLNAFADVVFIAEMEEKTVGYYSGKKRFDKELNKTIGNVIISAVDAEYRGLGIFSKLDNHILNWFSENTDFAEMGTYLINYPVHKTWINKSLSLKRGMHQLSKLYL